MLDQILSDLSSLRGLSAQFGTEKFTPRILRVVLARMDALSKPLERDPETTIKTVRRWLRAQLTMTEAANRLTAIVSPVPPARIVARRKIRAHFRALRSKTSIDDVLDTYYRLRREVERQGESARIVRVANEIVQRKLAGGVR